jgi:YHS domain-containing protein
MTSHDSVTDPVCGMRVNASSAADSRDHKGETYYFCSSWCARKFDQDAAAYIAASGLRGEGGGENTDDPHP